jgi:N-acetylneuraminic acid mutarotase
LFLVLKSFVVLTVPGSNDSFAKGAFKWTAALPSPVAPAGRSGHSAVFFQDSVYLFGGQCVLAMNEEEQNAEFYSDLWRLDVRTHQWSEVQTSGALPTGRNAHTACVVDDCMYVIGGSNQDGPLDDVAVLNLSMPMQFRASILSFQMI